MVRRLLSFVVALLVGVSPVLASVCDASCAAGPSARPHQHGAAPTPADAMSAASDIHEHHHHDAAASVSSGHVVRVSPAHACPGHLDVVASEARSMSSRALMLPVAFSMTIPADIVVAIDAAPLHCHACSPARTSTPLRI